MNIFRFESLDNVCIFTPYGQLTTPFALSVSPYLNEFIQTCEIAASEEQITSSHWRPESYVSQNLSMLLLKSHFQYVYTIIFVTLEIISLKLIFLFHYG